MRKIKVNLTSGNIVEKPLLTAFKGTYGDYLVLDNETVGSMGLPVILIAKVLDNKVSTITDANEWNAVKENLRNIIAGNQIIKINVLDEYSGEDVFYKQLTLPVASFDSLKNTFNDETDGSAVNGPVGEVPGAPEVADSVQPNVTPIEMPSAPQSESVVSNVTPQNVNPETVTAEQVQTPPTPEIPVAPEMPSPEATPMPEAPKVEEPVTPQVEPIPPMEEMANNKLDFEKEKETFLKACENMFDALVSKFNK